MIRIDVIQQNSNHLDRRKRHPSRASCEIAGRRYETTGPAPIYKLSTLLWLHGHGNAEFEVWDDVSPFDKPGGLAKTGCPHPGGTSLHHGRGRVRARRYSASTSRARGARVTSPRATGIP